MPLTDNEFEAQMDAETLVRAQEIEGDQGRMNRAKEFALRQEEHFKQVAASIPGRGGFTNNAVRGSKMQR